MRFVLRITLVAVTIVAVVTVAVNTLVGTLVGVDYFACRRTAKYLKLVLLFNTNLFIDLTLSYTFTWFVLSIRLFLEYSYSSLGFRDENSCVVEALVAVPLSLMILIVVPNPLSPLSSAFTHCRLPIELALALVLARPRPRSLLLLLLLYYLSCAVDDTVRKGVLVRCTLW